MAMWEDIFTIEDRFSGFNLGAKVVQVVGIVRQGNNKKEYNVYYRRKFRNKSELYGYLIWGVLTKKKCRDAMKVEMDALEKNTWEILNKPKGKNIVNCKWIFIVKYNVDGSIEKYKARLILKDTLKLME